MMEKFRLSGSKFSVNINQDSQISDLFFPSGATNNHLADPRYNHKIGIFVDGNISWLSDDSWRKSLHYSVESMTLRTEAHSDSLDLKFSSEDIITQNDVLLRKITLESNSSQKREIKLFFYQNFVMHGSSQAPDTAQILAENSLVLHYNDDKNFVLSAEVEISNGENSHWQKFDQFSVGLFGVDGLEGSWRDAEDGILSGARVEAGQTDSVIGFTFPLDTDQPKVNVQYALACGSDQLKVIELANNLNGKSFIEQFTSAQDVNRKWIARSDVFISKLDPALQKSFRRNLGLLKQSITDTGAILNYSSSEAGVFRMRDAAFAVWPLIRLGYKTESLRFLEWCVRVKGGRDYILSSYSASGCPGATKKPYFKLGEAEISPISIDETALVVFIAGEYYFKFHDLDFLSGFYKELIKPLADFLTANIDKNGLLAPTYNIWGEITLETTTYSTATVYAALKSASSIAQEARHVKDASKWENAASRLKSAAKSSLFNHESKYFYRATASDGAKDSRIDPMSLYGAYMFGLYTYNSSEITDSLQTFMQSTPNIYDTTSLSPIDSSYSLLPSLWLCEILIDQGRRDEATDIINYVDTCLGSGENSSISVWVRAEIISAMLDLIS